MVAGRLPDPSGTPTFQPTLSSLADYLRRRLACAFEIRAAERFERPFRRKALYTLGLFSDFFHFLPGMSPFYPADCSRHMNLYASYHPFAVSSSFARSRGIPVCRIDSARDVDLRLSSRYCWSAGCGLVDGLGGT